MRDVRERYWKNETVRQTDKKREGEREREIKS